MTTRDEVAAAVRAMIEEGRSEVGPEPTTEELLAYHHGELPPDEVDRMEERLANYPEAARLLAAFTGEGAQPEDSDFVSDDEVETAWRSFRTRVDRDEGRVPGPRREKRGSHLVSWLRSRPRWIEHAAVIAVVLVVGVYGYVKDQSHDRMAAQLTELRGPQVGAEHRVLRPDGPRRGAGDEPVARLPAASGPYLLTLALGSAEDYPDYRLDIVRTANGGPETLWSRTGLERRGDDTFPLYLPEGFLTPGRYQLRLYGLRGGAEALLATYTVEM
jgi:hypothetical protein